MTMNLDNKLKYSFGVFLEQSVRGQQAVRHGKEINYNIYLEYIIGYISSQS